MKQKMRYLVYTKTPGLIFKSDPTELSDSEIRNAKDIIERNMEGLNYFSIFVKNGPIIISGDEIVAIHIVSADARA